MEARKPPEYVLELYADPAFVKDMVKGVLHVIFFHRYFPAITPITRDLLDISLPAIDDPDLETLIDQRATNLLRALDVSKPSVLPTTAPIRISADGSGGRGQIVVQFFEKRRRKSYFFGKGDEDVCWECWTLDVTVSVPKSESDVPKIRKAMEKSLSKTILKMVNIVNRDKDHIPPITSADSNPFPYTITVNPRQESWGGRMGLF